MGREAKLELRAAREREQRTREECQRDLKNTTEDLLDELEGFDDSFKWTQIDGALDTVNGLCDECEEMLRDERP